MRPSGQTGEHETCAGWPVDGMASVWPEHAETEASIAAVSLNSLDRSVPLQMKARAVERASRAVEELADARAAYEAAQDVECPEAEATTTMTGRTGSARAHLTEARTHCEAFCASMRALGHEVLQLDEWQWQRVDGYPGWQGSRDVGAGIGMTGWLDEIEAFLDGQDESREDADVDPTTTRTDAEPRREPVPS